MKMNPNMNLDKILAHSYLSVTDKLIKLMRV